MRFTTEQRKRAHTDYIKGISSPIPYLIRSLDGDWRQDLPTYDGQREDGWDTSCCWLYAGLVVIATQCNFLLRTGQFPQTTIDWFKSNGYLDSKGKFAFSERYLASLATYPDMFGNYDNKNYVRDGGNDQIELPRLVKRYGLLPRADFDAAPNLTFASQKAFDDYFFDPTKVTDDMIYKAKKALEFISVQYEWIGKEWVMPPIQDMRAAILQAPLQIGVPVPESFPGWNVTNIKYDGGRTAQHSVSMPYIPSDNSFYIRDQYKPDDNGDKTLSSDYFIPMVSMIYVTPILPAPYIPPETAIPYPSQENVWVKVWNAVARYFGLGV